MGYRSVVGSAIDRCGADVARSYAATPSWHARTHSTVAVRAYRNRQSTRAGHVPVRRAPAARRHPRAPHLHPPHRSQAYRPLLPTHPLHLLLNVRYLHPRVPYPALASLQDLTMGRIEDAAQLLAQCVLFPAPAHSSARPLPEAGWPLARDDAPHRHSPAPVRASAGPEPRVRRPDGQHARQLRQRRAPAWPKYLHPLRRPSPLSPPSPALLSPQGLQRGSPPPLWMG